MLKVILVFENQYASPNTPREYVLGRYLTIEAKKDIRYINIDQDVEFQEMFEISGNGLVKENTD